MIAHIHSHILDAFRDLIFLISHLAGILSFKQQQQQESLAPQGLVGSHDQARSAAGEEDPRPICHRSLKATAI